MSSASPRALEQTAAAPESVRLVIWDLDDTFWRGTLAEGGIEAFIEANHELVVELCRRGIMNSICSKNDAERAMAVLAELGLADYFVFPSISFSAKGPRVAEIIETVGLRAPTVLFIDDHPANRAEAEAFAPGVQTADESLAARMLDDPRFRGKDDAGLTRLAQYKLLERRERDRTQSVRGAEAFLRDCDIRVALEFDIEAHVDRAIELVNRTNQLNFTKRRLSENPEEARAELLGAWRSFEAQAALVRVSDRYGDYGFAGFYLLLNGRTDYGQGGSPSRLLHFCFSCRVLGMGVERWLYAHLGRPEIAVASGTATELTAGGEVDWVTIGAPREIAAPVEPIAPEICAQGGCEMLALASYLRPYAGKCEVVGNVHVGSVFLTLNSAALALSTLQQPTETLAPILAELELPAEVAAPRLFERAPEGTVLLFSAAHDAYPDAPRYRHRGAGWEFHCALRGFGVEDLAGMDEATFAAQLADLGPNFYRDDERRRLLRFRAALAKSFERRAGAEDPFVALGRLIEMTPPRGKFVLALDGPRVRRRSGEMTNSPTTLRYNEAAREIVSRYPFAAAVEFADAIASDAEIVGLANHYERRVYLRAAELIRGAIARLPGR